MPDAFPLTHESQGWDSNLYEVSRENVAITTEMEGGYMTSRPRHTRSARKSFKMGWRSTSDAAKQALEGFYADVARGSSNLFTWFDPDSATTYTVRFKSGDGISFKYVGFGPVKLWDIEVTLEQV